MSQLITSLLITIFLICLAKTVVTDSVCGDWQTFNDEKCFVIFDALQSYDDAVNSCIQYNATLVTIQSLEEQKFVETYLFTTHKIVENVWTGLKYTNSQYKWINNLEANYTHWSEGSPKNRSDYCVQIDSDDGFLGKWSDVSCTKRNLVMCQRLPTITMQLLQSMLINTRKQTDNIIQQLSNKLENNAFQQNIKNLALEDATKKLENSLVQQNVTNHMLITTVNEFSVSKKQFDYFFSDKWIEFQTFVENNTRKAFFYPYKTQYHVLRSEALAICRQHNASLVDIESIEKQKHVESFLNKINPKTESNNYWLGGYIDSADNYKYKWLNSGNVLTYTNWSSGYPASNEPYIFIAFNTEYSDYRQWFSTTSILKHNVFCEITFY